MRVETFILTNDWKKAAAVAKGAEDAGFDAVITPEIDHDPFIPLAFAATETSKIQLGTGIAVAFPRSPMITAGIAWDLQAASGGRFSLGLGSQVKGHNERRFSVPWTLPVPRLREYVQSLRAIWRCWELGEPLKFEGEHYNFSLMTPEFSPKPTGLPPVPVSVAAVRPPMIRMAGRICDGVKLHGFATRKYLEETAIPKLNEGLERSKRKREQFEICGGGFIATGATDEEVAKAVELIRYRIAFYGSTRTYHVVLEPHGWEDLGLKLHQMSKTGKWKEMAAAVTDDVLHEFTAVARYDQLKSAVEKRFGGMVDTIALGYEQGIDPGPLKDVVRELQTVPSAFQGYSDLRE